MPGQLLPSLGYHTLASQAACRAGAIGALVFLVWHTHMVSFCPTGGVGAEPQASQLLLPGVELLQQRAGVS